MNNSTKLHSNNPTWEMKFPELVAWCSVFTLVDIAIVIGNSITIAVFYINKRLLRTRANYFLINLAVADMLVGTIALPMYVYHLIAAWTFGNQVYQAPLFRISVVMDVFVGCASVFTLTIIALERLYCVCWPHLHRQTTLKVYYMQLGLLWLLSAVVASLRLMFAYKLLTLNFFMYVLLSTFAVSLFVICVAYTIIWCKMKFRLKKKGAKKYEKGKSNNEQEKRLAIILSTVTVVFVFTWLPFHVVNTIAFFCHSCRDFAPQFAYILKVFHFGNSFVNPIVYSFLVPEFRKTVKKLFRRR